jgi:hypothetical protein
MRRCAPYVVIAGLATLVFAISVGSAALLAMDAATLQVISLPVELPISHSNTDVIVDIKPETLNLDSDGDHVTAFIELPGATGSIDPASVRLCRGISTCGTEGVPASDPMWISGGHTLKVTFDRAAVIALLDDVEPPADVTLTVSGIADEVPFAGSDVIRVVSCECDEVVDPAPQPGRSASPTPDPTPESDEPTPEGSPPTAP